MDGLAEEDLDPAELEDGMQDPLAPRRAPRSQGPHIAEPPPKAARHASPSAPGAGGGSMPPKPPPSAPASVRLPPTPKPPPSAPGTGSKRGASQSIAPSAKSAKVSKSSGGKIDIILTTVRAQYQAHIDAMVLGKFDADKAGLELTLWGKRKAHSCHRK